MGKINTLDFTNVIDPAVKKHFVDAYGKKKFDISLLFSVDSQTNKVDTFKNYTGTSELALVTENGTYTEDAPIQSYGVSLTAAKYGKLIKVTDEIQKFAKTKEIYNAAKFHGDAAARTEQKKAASVFNNSTSGSYLSMTDNVSLGDASHPRADGGAAQSNLTSYVLSDANLEAAILKHEAYLDDRGNMITSFPDKILVPNALRKSAKIILKSNGQSDTSDNNINVYNGGDGDYGTMKLIVWDYLGAAAGGSDTAWYLIDSTNNGLMWQWVEHANVTRDTSSGFTTDTAIYKVRDWFSYGWRDWRGVTVNTGA